ncbi:hypothetical protein GN956_G18595 [Arapaima gigas]
MTAVHAGVLVLALFCYLQLQVAAMNSTTPAMNHTTDHGSNGSSSTEVPPSNSNVTSTNRPSGAAPCLHSGSLSLLFPIAVAASVLRPRC